MKVNWTITFIAINFLVFVLEFFLPLTDIFSFVPANAFSEPWTFVTSIFLHAHLTCDVLGNCVPYFNHIFFNMIALFFFGLYLESRVSSRVFLFNYFLAGIIGNIAYLITDPVGIIPAVGASGAIYGVMGALTILAPSLIVFIGGFMPMPMAIAAIFWVILNVVGLFNPSGIAYQAHLGGIFVGILVGLYLRLRIKKKDYVFYFE